MPIRVTQEYKEISATGQTPKLRVTQEYKEISATGQTPKLRVTQEYKEISATGQIPRLRITQVYKEISAPVINTVPLYQDLSDQLSLNDYLETFAVYTAELTDQITLQESLNVLLLVHISLIVQERFDIFNLDDSIALVLSYLIDVSGNQLTFDDYFLYFQKLYSHLYDSLNIQDLSEYAFNFKLNIHEFNLLIDAVYSYLNYINTNQDGIFLVDNINLKSILSKILGDDINLLDSIGTISPVGYILTLGSITNLADKLAIYNIESDDYIRRYLNDRLLKMGELIIAVGDKMEAIDGIG
jgi:hypothetical protein